jgi:CRISPR-associated exonuclease Cas4
LIHLEDVWRDNVFTVRGDILHEKIDTDTYESRGVLKTVRGLRIHSFRLGIVGRADVVEFRQSSTAKGGIEITPVEFKSGETKDDISDKAQLCAQVFCLEDMLNTTIHKGVFFYNKIRRRVQIEIDNALRQQTEEIIGAVRGILDQKNSPSAVFSDKCKNCSIEPLCMPKAMNERRLKHYMEALYQP